MEIELQSKRRGFRHRKAATFLCTAFQEYLWKEGMNLTNGFCAMWELVNKAEGQSPDEVAKLQVPSCQPGAYKLLADTAARADTRAWDEIFLRRDELAKKISDRVSAAFDRVPNQEKDVEDFLDAMAQVCQDVVSLAKNNCESFSLSRRLFIVKDSRILKACLS